MEFMKDCKLQNKLDEYTSRVEQRKSHVTDENKAKQYLIIPFFTDVLGWDYKDPSQFVPEFPPELGKPGECVDYALIDNQGKAVIFVEAKGPQIQLEDVFDQLSRYVSLQSTVRFGVITNGLQYLWYQRDKKNNYLIGEPFLKYDPSNPTSHDARILRAFENSEFRPESAYDILRDIEFETRLHQFLKRSLTNPSDNFVRWLVKELKDKPFALNLPRVSPQNVASFQELVARVFSRLMFETQGKSSKFEIDEKKIPEDKPKIQPPPAEASETCQLKNGKILNRYKTKRRAYWFENHGFIECEDAQSTFLQLLSCFANKYPLGPDEFINRLCGTFAAFNVDRRSTKFHQKEFIGRKIWVRHYRNNVKKNVVSHVANWFNPPYIEGQNYGLWLPEGKPKKGQ